MDGICVFATELEPMLGLPVCGLTLVAERLNLWVWFVNELVSSARSSVVLGKFRSWESVACILSTMSSWPSSKGLAGSTFVSSAFLSSLLVALAFFATLRGISNQRGQLLYFI
jgi:hypothetical protein